MANLNIAELISADGLPVAQPQQVIKAAPQQQSSEPVVTSIDALPKEDVNEPAIQSVEPADKKVLVTIDDFLNAKGNDDIVPKVKTEQEIKDDAKLKEINAEKALQAKKEKEVLDIEQKTTQQDISKAKVIEKDGRDYSDIPEEEKPLWRKMSNDSFNQILPKVKELKVIKVSLAKKEEEFSTLRTQLEEAQKGIVRLPENYNEHPAAFVLTPEFKQISNNVNIAQQVYSHWEEQLIAVKGGAKEISILGNDNNGNIIETGKQPVDERTELMLGRLISGSDRQLANEQARLNMLAQSHSAKASEVKQWVQAQEKDAFAVFEVPDNKTKMTPIINDTISKFPAALQSNILMSSYAKALITISTLRGMLEQAKAAQLANGNGGGTAKVAATIKNNGPTAGEIAGGGGATTQTKTAAQQVNLDDFRRAKGEID